MLKAEILKANPALSTLTEEQVSTIETLSANDENAVISKRIGELHGQYDQDILSVSGMEKQQGEKSYNYAKRVIDVLKKSGGDTSKLDELKKKNEELETKLKEGVTNDAALKEWEQKVNDSESKFTQLQTQFEQSKKEWESKITEKANENLNIRTMQEFESGLVGVTFDPLVKEDVRKTFIKSIRKGITSEYTRDFIDNGKGGQQMVFRDSNGEILRNPENGLNPFTAKELQLSKLTSIIDTGKQQSGAGTKGGNGNGKGAFVLNGAKTQIEADGEISKHLMGKGIPKGTEKFTAEHKKIRQESGVEKLPMR